MKDVAPIFLGCVGIVLLVLALFDYIPWYWAMGYVLFFVLATKSQ